MKLKKFLKPVEECTFVKLLNADEELYRGTIENIPERLLNYKIDCCGDVYISAIQRIFSDVQEFEIVMTIFICK